MKRYIYVLGMLFLINMISCKKENKVKLDTTEMVNDSIYYENHDNGAKKIVAKIKDEKFNGKYLVYSKKGMKKVVGLMKNNKKIGYWKEFNEIGDLVRVEKFVNDSLIYEMDVSDFIMENVLIDEYSLSVKLPKEWKKKTNHIDEELLLYTVKKCQETKGICPTLTITTEKLPEKMEFEYFVNETKKIIPKYFDKFKSIQLKKNNINGLESYKLSYHAKLKDIVIGGEVTWIKRKNDIFTVTVVAQNDKKYKDFLKFRLLFDEIIGTIEIN